MLRLCHRRIIPIHGLAVMGRQQHVTDHFPPNAAADQIMHGGDVAYRFGHFLVVQCHKTVVHPVANKGLPPTARTLGAFVFVVGKQQILPAAMNINGFAQMPVNHGGAFQMPARTPRTKGAVPRRFVGCRGLP